MLPILVGMVIGIVGCRYGCPWHVAAFILLVCAVLVWRAKWGLALIGFSVVLGWVTCNLNTPCRFNSIPDQSAEFEGTVSNISSGNSGRRLTVKVEKAVSDGAVTDTLTFRALLTLPFFQNEIEIGDRIRFGGTFSDPYAAPSSPIENDVRGYYYCNGISLVCYVPKDRLEITGRDNNLYYRLRRVADGVTGLLYSSGLEGETAAFMTAILTGDDEDITDECRKSFSSSGIAHVLALSGAHLAVLSWILSILFFPLAIAGFRKGRWVLTLVGVWLFALMTGMSPSVVRASIMVSAVMLSLILDRPRSSVNSLCFAAVIILLFSPRSLFSVGFQLTFAATLAILFFSQKFNPVKKSSNIRYRLLGMVSVTLAATLGTLPLIVWHFHQIPLYFIPANILAVVLLPLMIGGGILLVLFMQAGFDPAWIVGMLDWCYSVLSGVSAWIAGLPSANVEDIWISPWVLVTAYLTIGMLAYALLAKKRSSLLWAAVLAVMTMGVWFLSDEKYPEAELFIPPHHGSTEIFIRQDKTLTVITGDKECNIAADSVEWVATCGDYIGSRGVDDIVITSNEGFSRAGTVSFGDLTLRFGNVISGSESSRADYHMVTSGFRGNVIEFAEQCRADTILLSADINKRRRERYERELREAGIPVCNLNDKPLHLIVRRD